MSSHQVQIDIKRKRELAGNDAKQHRTGFRCKRHAVAQLVEALRYEPEGRGFDFRWGSSEIFL